MHSHGEAGAAAAAGNRIRILDLEGLAQKIVDKVDLGARHVDQRNRVDQHGRAIAGNHDVVVLLVLVEVEFVGKARTAAAFDGDAQGVLVGIGRDNGSDSFRCGLGKCHVLRRHVAS